jgi:hypothetical protein
MIVGDVPSPWISPDDEILEFKKGRSNSVRLSSP